MKQQVVINKGKRFLVNVATNDDGVGAGCPPGIMWLQDENGAWYSVQLTGVSGSLSFAITAIPTENYSVGMYANDYGFQLVNANDGLPYQVYIDSAGPTVVISQSAAPFDEGKPYLFLQSNTDFAYYYVTALNTAGTITLETNDNTRISDGTIFAGGSMLFGGANNRYVFYTTTGESQPLNFGTGSFTVEWFQFMQYQTTFARVFTQGVWPTAEFGVSIENAAPNANFYLWLDGRGNTAATSNSASVTASHLNRWNHFAVCRESGSAVRIFRNGVNIKTITDPQYVTSSISSSARLIIGGEGDNVVNTFFSGSITNFRIVKDALYTSNFAIPRAPLSIVPKTTFLMLAATQQDAFLESVSGTRLTGSATLYSANNPTVIGKYTIPLVT